MFKHRAMLGLLTAILVSASTGSQNSRDLQLVSAVKVDSAASPDAGFIGRWKWRHGTYLVVSRADPAFPSFFTIDRQGSMSSEFSIRPPGASRLWVSDFDRLSDGTAVFCGGAYSETGQLAPFLAWMSPDGNSIRVVRTDPYWANMLSVAPDGTVWTVGEERINGHIDAPGSNPNGDVLRHFNSSGKLIDSLLPRSKFRGALRVTYGYLQVTHDRLGWYGPDQGKGEYTEISLDTKKEHDFPGMPGEPNLANGVTKVLGFALTDSDKVYLTCDPSSGVRTTYTLDRASESWVALNVPALNGMARPVLNGVEGEQLVFRGGDSLGFLEPTR